MPASTAAAREQDTKSEDGSATGFTLADFGDSIDASTFEQILEMDDDEEEREFSRSIVYDFFTQADGTFKNMDNELANGNLGRLSELGHFLKGSSATLGLAKVQASCEKIQHYGAQKDETGNSKVDDKDLCLKNCRTEIARAKTDFKEAERLLKRFYHDDGTGAGASA
ncbi:Multistep phosphorelay regulator 1 [Acrodontium crateriforme]|uniref:Multistep phosphorelay regulator 1 n=1 Tax=Acrodontium crateriforme TaxID=150365 RepID=A0AAQ3MA55_9PEZI|nr:Multistep phosphorelay regulator 1 [Acrodontium crateriforme]